MNCIHPVWKLQRWNGGVIRCTSGWIIQRYSQWYTGHCVKEKHTGTYYMTDLRENPSDRTHLKALLMLLTNICKKYKNTLTGLYIYIAKYKLGALDHSLCVSLWIHSVVPFCSQSHFHRSWPHPSHPPCPHATSQLHYGRPFVHTRCDLCLCVLERGPKSQDPDEPPPNTNTW